MTDKPDEHYQKWADRLMSGPESRLALPEWRRAARKDGIDDLDLPKFLRYIDEQMGMITAVEELTGRPVEDHWEDDE